MGPILILGNCIAAVSAAAAIRELDTSSEVIICSAEPYYAYYRVSLSSLLGTIFSPEEILIYQPSWYQKKQIEVLLGRRGEKVFPEKREVLLDNGEFLSYQRLIIATGARAALPPVQGLEKQGFFTLRNYQDCREIWEYGEDKKAFVVVGGGVLGLEVAWALRQREKEVTLLVKSDKILRHQLDEEGSRFLEKLVREKGIHVVFHGEAAALEGPGRVEGITLKRGEVIPAEVVISAVGISPERNLFPDNRLYGKRGILVDRYMRTGDEHIFAAGDVAEWRGKIQGRWPVAKIQGEIAGYNAAGQEKPFEEMPPFNLVQVMDTMIYSVGEVEGEDLKALASAAPGKEFFRKLFFRGNKLVGGILIGDTTHSFLVKEAIMEEKDFSNILGKNPDVNYFLSYLMEIEF